MKACYYLYKKEINSLMFLQSVILLLIFGWFFFLYYKAPVWPAPVIFGLGFLPLTFLPVLMLWQGYHSFKKEWENDTIYYLLSLPRHGWQLILSKLLAGLTIYFIATVISLALIYSINQAWILQMLERLPVGITPDWIRGVVFKLGIGYILSGLVIYIFSQLSFLFSRIYRRFNGLMGIIIFILNIYLFFRLGGLLAPFLAWAPDLPVNVSRINADITRQTVVYLGSGPLLGSLVVLLGLLWLGSIVLENYLEV